MPKIFFLAANKAACESSRNNSSIVDCCAACSRAKAAAPLNSKDMAATYENRLRRLVDLLRDVFKQVSDQLYDQGTARQFLA